MSAILAENQSAVLEIDPTEEKEDKSDKADENPLPTLDRETEEIRLTRDADEEQQQEQRPIAEIHQDETEVQVDDQNQEETKETKEPLIDANDEHVDGGDLRDEEDEPVGSKDATLPMPDKKKPLSDDTDHDETGGQTEDKTRWLFLHPIDRLRYAWNNSANGLEFFIRAACIIFASVGWLFLVGGIPLLSIVQLIMGSIYVDDCPAEPRIPRYLIVSGVFGTILHCISVCTKYAPKNRDWPFQKQRRRCICLEILLQVFLLIWFLAGCSWVYGIYEPEYSKKEQDNYCHKTVYLFTFWIFNLSFIFLSLIFAIGTCCIICVAASPESKDKKQKDRNSVFV